MSPERMQYAAKLRAMHEDVSSRTRRSILAASAVGGTFLFLLLAAASYAQTVRTADAQPFVTSPLPGKQNAATQDDSIRTFHINVPDEQLVDLRQRLAATRWPDKETVNDESQGIRLAQMQALLDYWGNGYNWRNGEAKLNALPEFVTTIDGVDIQFIHVRSREPNALPLILTHGWPGSPLEFLKVIGPRTDPVAYGGRAQDAFDVVIPAIPGYGFSGKPTDLGWNPDRVARAWDVLIRSKCRSPSRCSRTRSIARQKAGHVRLIRRCTTSMKLPRAVTSQHGNSPNSSPRSSELHSDRSANSITSGFETDLI